MSFILSTQSELLKTKRSASVWLTVLGALFIPGIFLLMYLSRPDIFAPQLTFAPWRQHFLRGWQSVSAFLFPMFVILICTLIPQIEYKNNTWKQVFASPQSIGNIFFSKMVTIHLMILFCFLLFNIFMIGSALVTNLINPHYSFLKSKIDIGFLLKLNLKTYISVLGISAIQYWLSLRLKNFIAPIGIGLALLITALILLQWKHIYKIPYAHPMLTLLSYKGHNRPFIENHELNSIGYFIAFTVIGFLDMKYRTAD